MRNRSWWELLRSCGRLMLLTGPLIWVCPFLSLIFTTWLIHLSQAEEIENAATVIPYSMILTTLINGSAGFAILVAFVFCMVPLEEVLNDAFSFPLITMLLRITKSTAVTTTLVSSSVFNSMISCSLSISANPHRCQSLQCLVYHLRLANWQRRPACSGHLLVKAEYHSLIG